MEYEPITKLFEAEGATTIPIPEDYVPDPTIITDLREVKVSATIHLRFFCWIGFSERTEIFGTTETLKSAYC